MPQNQISLQEQKSSKKIEYETLQGSRVEFRAGLWHFLLENLPATNASKPTLCKKKKFGKNGLNPIPTNYTVTGNELRTEEKLCVAPDLHKQLG